jgi:hypothetical protein
MSQANPLAAVAIPDATALAAMAIPVAARFKGVAAPVIGDGGHQLVPSIARAARVILRMARQSFFMRGLKAPTDLLVLLLVLCRASFRKCRNIK